MPRRERHMKLTEDPDVKRWYESFDSQKTAKDRLRQLGLFCERKGTTPKGYVKLSTKAGQEVGVIGLPYISPKDKSTNQVRSSVPDVPQRGVDLEGEQREE